MTGEQKKKIFIGTMDIASQIKDFTTGFQRLGYDTFSVVHQKNGNISTTKADVNLSELFSKHEGFFSMLPSFLKHRLRNRYQHYIKKRVLMQAAKECDIFIFMWSSFFHDYSDIELLKKMGKKVVVFFVGTDIRMKDAYEQDVARFGIPTFYVDASNVHEWETIENKLRFMRTFEKHADLIFSLPNQSQLALRPYHHFWVPVIIENIVENTLQREVPVIFHAPTKRWLKGTGHLMDALERLRSEGMKFELKLIENMPNDQALKEYTNGDILVGELYIPSAGKLDREALAAGAVVLSSIRRDYIDHIPEDCPIIDINPDNLYDELKKIIPDTARRKELAKQGRRYVEKYHNIDIICKNILTMLDSKDESYDYYPSFFREKYEPLSREEAEMCNRFTGFVSGSDWYKKHVPPGERSGLRF
jgi:glycosyltransferase involved in cell wall biosynthesis